ncbi:MAG: DUF1566 domain-containing protein [Rhodoferax sp.]|nr:DUF1566 domain-containing protein [Rhodoferax sp.]
MFTPPLTTHSLPFHPWAVLSAILLCANTLHAAPTGLLNDTGQTTCDNGGDSLVNCQDNATIPGQDGHFGRDASVKPTEKKGSGAAGFDFTRICMDGSSNCAGSADTGSNPAPSAWACTKDNHTNLIWSLATQQGQKMTSYTDNRCGFSTGWRLPTRLELLSIVHNGTNSPAIDTQFFPGTSSGPYWTSELHILDGSRAWTIDFRYGAASYADLTTPLYLRLVRDGE